MTTSTAAQLDSPVNPFVGFVVGAAIGDSIGLPREGLSARRAARIYGGPPLEHQLCFGRGGFSDDTEHLVLTALSLLRHPADESAFVLDLSKSLRCWLLCLPAGVGMATARSILRLWLGFSPETSGVFSAGNGPAMRSGILGLYFRNDPARLRKFVRASTRITHTDSKAEIGALAIALSARFAALHPLTADNTVLLLDELRALMDDKEWLTFMTHVGEGLSAKDSPEHFAARLGITRGVRGYIYETVAVALFCWLTAPLDYRRVVESAIVLGGDTDTVAAIAGGLAGVTAGRDNMPSSWSKRMADWPLTIAWLQQLADDVDRCQSLPVVPPKPRSFPWLQMLPRNLLFLAVVLTHGFRRLLPPY